MGDIYHAATHLKDYLSRAGLTREWQISGSQLDAIIFKEPMSGGGDITVTVRQSEPGASVYCFDARPDVDAGAGTSHSLLRAINETNGNVRFVKFFLGKDGVVRATRRESMDEGQLGMETYRTIWTIARATEMLYRELDGVGYPHG